MKKLLFLVALCMATVQATSALTYTKASPTAVQFALDNGLQLTLDFYGPNIVRVFCDPAGGAVRDPQATPPAQILDAQPRRAPGTIEVKEEDGLTQLLTSRLIVAVTSAGRLSFVDRASGRSVSSLPAAEGATFLFEPGSTTLKLTAAKDAWFYGGGVQNGRFSHRGKRIAIVNTNSWVDGGVASPTPFYWSTEGYGLLWHTFTPGSYDFGTTDPQVVTLSHQTPYLDVFFMFDAQPVALLNDYYQLTGHPVLLPKFGFYEGHLNAYNRDYWKAIDDTAADTLASPAGTPASATAADGFPTGTTPASTASMAGPDGSVLFENGRYYKESQTDNGGVRESLNGEAEGSYRFSARAVIDRYNAANMPLGWVLPNDGYGAGYGQAGTLDGNIENLRQFADYAHQHGVEVGLWTQSDLYPKEGVEPLLQRDIVKEVRDAGVRVLKTDVAWVGAGYSFGLNGVADIAAIMPREGNNARPFIISVDGWAGTQRYAGIWTGDQTGGDWEYIRFHIPTYIGAGLSGQPNISSDMDGIFGGRNVPVNVRDFQWKTFTPMQLNMDGWGRHPKYPQGLGEPATSVNRTYLKLRSMLMPYLYTLAHEAIDGKPMVRAMFLDEPNAFTHGVHTRYQFLCGPSILVAPIYQDTEADEQGNDIRNDIYLPAGQWIDFFSGECYEGGQVLNGFRTPLWKLPVFIRRGAIIPMIHAHNNPNQIDRHTRAFIFYPKGHTEFTQYDDDGRTEAYRTGAFATTRVESLLDERKGRLTLTVHPTKGTFQGFEAEKSTELLVNLQQQPKKIVARINGKKVRLDQARDRKDFAENTNVWFYDPAPEYNRFATGGTPMAQIEVKHSPRLYVCIADQDITATTITLEVEGYTFDTSNHHLHKSGSMQTPVLRREGEQGAYAVTPSWQGVTGADYYELQLVDHSQPGQPQESPVYTQVGADASATQALRPTSFTFADLQPETDYEVRIRAVNSDGATPWASATYRTTADPLREALRGIMAQTSCENQPGQGIDHLTDFDEKTTWHTSWSQTAVPFDITIDLHAIAQLDKLLYVPRTDAGNGTITRGTVCMSMDRVHWSQPVPFQWQPNSQPKELSLRPASSAAISSQSATGGTTTSAASALPATARYLRIHVDEARGGFGSGQQLYVFKQAGTDSYLPGDLNQDGRLDENDLTSYMNYNGLRQGDADFEGYISKGDLNQNGLIDAYDISAVAVELEGGVAASPAEPVAGTITVKADRQVANAGDLITLTVSGKGLVSVNALSMAIPYDASQLEYVGTQALGMQQMRNLTTDRLHSNGQKALYPTFVNCGNHPCLTDGTLLSIQFRAKRKGKVTFDVREGLLVDKNLNTISW